MRLTISLRIAALLMATTLLAACSPAEQTGPVQVRWDKEPCERCAMSVGDRMFAAQVRGGLAGSKTRAYKFDDLGCAVIWLEQQDWKDDPRTEIWVTDHRDGLWIDARTAHYVTGLITPMAYGLGAQARAESAELDFDGAVKHIHMIESTAHKQRGGHQHHGGS